MGRPKCRRGGGIKLCFFFNAGFGHFLGTNFFLFGKNFPKNLFFALKVTKKISGRKWLPFFVIISFFLFFFLALAEAAWELLPIFWVSKLILSFYLFVSLFLLYRFCSKAHTSDCNLKNCLKKIYGGHGGRPPPPRAKK